MNGWRLRRRDRPLSQRQSDVAVLCLADVLEDGCGVPQFRLACCDCLSPARSESSGSCIKQKGPPVIRVDQRPFAVLHRSFAVLVLLSVCASPPAACADASGPSGVFPNEEIRVGGQLRRFRLVVPETVDRTKPVPLVVAFHGMLIDSKDVMPKYTKLDELAVKKRFLIVFPAAVDHSWGIAADKVVADLKFFDAILAEVGKRYRVDANRIYVVGMSNGGYFAHLVGKERSQKIAAVCSHSGPLGLQTLLGIRAERKFPVMIVHGEEDRIFPVAFARENRDKYHREGHVVKYVEVPGLNHYWATNSEINEQIWKFFESHTLASE